MDLLSLESKKKCTLSIRKQLTVLRNRWPNHPIKDRIITHLWLYSWRVAACPDPGARQSPEPPLQPLATALPDDSLQLNCTRSAMHGEFPPRKTSIFILKQRNCSEVGSGTWAEQLKQLVLCWMSFLEMSECLVPIAQTAGEPTLSQEFYYRNPKQDYACCHLIVTKRW